MCIGVGWGSAGGLTTAGTEAIAQPTGLGGFLGLVAAGLIPVLFSFGGWQHGTYVAGVARDPARTVPGGILVGVAVVVACYLTVNLAYLALLGQDAMAGSQALAAEAASVALGRVAGSVLAAAIVVSAAGILNTICLAFPYVIFAMARDGLFPERAGRLHPRTGTPATAMAIQGAWASVVVLAGAERIDLLLAGLAFGEWAFFAAVAVALLRLRRTWPPGSPGFRAPLWAAVGFAGIAAAIAIGALVVKPAESAFGVGVLILGLAVYAWRQRRVAP